MEKIKQSLYRSVRKDEFVGGVMTESGEAMDRILHGDIDPRALIVRGKKTTRQDWRRDHEGYFKAGHGTSLWDMKGVFGYPNWHYFCCPRAPPPLIR